MCAFVARRFDELNAQTDLVIERELALVRLAPKWWPANPGSCLVIPKDHFENIYELPPEVGHEVWDLARELALRFKRVLKCDGVSLRQHNEPAGDQDLWHFHLHVFPRYTGDRLYERHNEAKFVGIPERAEFASRLRGCALVAQPLLAEFRLVMPVRSQHNRRMHVQIHTVTIEAADPQQLAEFWRALLGYAVFTDSVQIGDPSGKGLRMLFAPSPRDKASTNRIHLIYALTTSSKRSSKRWR